MLPTTRSISARGVRWLGVRKYCTVAVFCDDVCRELYSECFTRKKHGTNVTCSHGERRSLDPEAGLSRSPSDVVLRGMQAWIAAHFLCRSSNEGVILVKCGILWMPFSPVLLYGSTGRALKYISVGVVGTLASGEF